MRTRTWLHKAVPTYSHAQLKTLSTSFYIQPTASNHEFLQGTSVDILLCFLHVCFWCSPENSANVWKSNRSCRLTQKRKTLAEFCWRRIKQTQSMWNGRWLGSEERLCQCPFRPVWGSLSRATPRAICPIDVSLNETQTEVWTAHIVMELNNMTLGQMTCWPGDTSAALFPIDFLSHFCLFLLFSAETSFGNVQCRGLKFWRKTRSADHEVARHARIDKTRKKLGLFVSIRSWLNVQKSVNTQFLFIGCRSRRSLWLAVDATDQIILENLLKKSPQDICRSQGYIHQWHTHQDSHTVHFGDQVSECKCRSGLWKNWRGTKIFFERRVKTGHVDGYDSRGGEWSKYPAPNSGF